MDRLALYEKIVALVPIIIREKEDFRNVIKNKLREYVNLLKQLDVVYQPSNWDEILRRIEQLCGGINRAVEAEYCGVRHTAYSSIKNQLNGYRTKESGVSALSCNIYKVNKGTISYRMRKVDMIERQGLKSSEMFHIPLSKRGLVRTQRFSALGYPCLYMSHSIYGCWEEMGRPNFGTIMVSKVVAQNDFNVLDLRVPSNDLWRKNMENCVKFFPFVIASMVQVKNHDDYYKPEYLIPQLLTEWTISQNRDKRKSSLQEIIGIIYTSAQKNSDFNFPFVRVHFSALPFEVD